jgi:peptidoglycan/LPS O-acetylase OafA/YrhL
VVLTVSFTIGLILQVPRDLVDHAKSLLATELFAANIFYWKTAGYFEPATLLRPLVHTWSLGVEEQFYLLYPAFLLGVLKLPRSLARTAIVTAFVVSLAVSITGVMLRPSAAFYLLPSRAWELLLGGMIAMGYLPLLRRRWATELQSALGSLFIALSILFYTDATPFPGIAALLPAVGAAMIIHAGEHRQTSVGILLSHPVPVGVGLISYALYLWHWPVFAFMRYVQVQPELGLTAQLGGLALTFLFSIASLKWLERPLRDRRRFKSSTVALGCLAASVLLGSIATAAILAKGLPNRFDQPIQRYAASAQDEVPQVVPCFWMPLNEAFSGQTCRLGSDGPPTFVLWGDSQAGHVAPAISEVARQHGLAGRLLIAPACPPIPRPHFGKFIVPAEQEACDTRNAAIIERLRSSRSIKTVILFGLWQGDAEIDAAQLDAGLDRSIAELDAAGKDVVLVHGVPFPDFDVPRVVVQRVRFGPSLPILAPSTEPFLSKSIGRIQTSRHARSLSLAPALCDQHRRCPVVADGRVIYIDSAHLSLFANETLLTPYLKDRLFASSQAHPAADDLGREGRRPPMTSARETLR